MDDTIIKHPYPHEEGCLYEIVEPKKPRAVPRPCSKSIRGHAGRIPDADSFLLNIWNWLIVVLVSIHPGLDEDELIVLGLREWPFKLGFNPRYLCVRHERAIKNAKAKYSGTSGADESSELLGAAGLAKCKKLIAALAARREKIKYWDLPQIGTYYCSFFSFFLSFFVSDSGVSRPTGP